MKLKNVYYIRKDLINKTRTFKNRSYIREKKIYIFVYGTLKKSYLNHSLLRNAKFISTGKTKNKFCIYSNGLFPTITKHTSNKKSYQISGEVYLINSEILANLDKFEGYIDTIHKKLNMYNREVESILLTNGEELDCNIYISERGNGLIYNKGSWTK